MKRGTIIGLSIIGIIFLFALILYFWGKNTYNGFIKSNENVKRSWGAVQTAYQRRADLIPNLVNTVKGYAQFERGVLTDVTEARAKVSQMNVTPEVLNNPQAFQKFQQLQGELSNAISRLLVTVENYPELKASENFLQLQAQLEGTENRIKVARDHFNDSINEYNTTVKSFPNVILAGMFGFSEKAYFQAAPGTETAPKVEFESQ